MTLSWLDDRLWFPDPKRSSPEGFVAVGGDMTVDRLLLAYKSGIFPWTDDPITWWSPDPRGIFELGKLHVSRSLAHVLKRGVFQVTFDQAFDQVIRGCAEVPRQDQNTWISPYFIESYTELHRAGFAHSVEVWQQGELVGGLYGVSIGGFFAGESMFHKASNASKVAVASLVGRMKERGMTLFDTQMVTPATAQLGAVEIPRNEYLKRVQEATAMKVSFI